MRKLILLYQYFIYRVKSTNEHGVHSPFVFDLVTNVIYNDKDYYIYRPIENLREKLVHSNSHTVSELAKELLPAKYDQLLFRLVNYFQPGSILVVGDSPCLDAIYLASANSKTKVVVASETQVSKEILRENTKQLKLKNIELYKGNAIMNDYLKDNTAIDFVYIDCKTAERTLIFFHRCLESISDSGVFIVSGLNESSEMKEAWAEIKANAQVKVTIDLFYLGIVFFRKEQVKEHFLIRF